MPELGAKPCQGASCYRTPQEPMQHLRGVLTHGIDGTDSSVVRCIVGRMIRRYANWIVAALLVALVTGACIVRTRPAPRGRPVYVQPEKHKHKKHKHKKHDQGRGNAYGRDKNR